jgi:hypothetical protein
MNSGTLTKENTPIDRLNGTFMRNTSGLRISWGVL